MVLKISLQVTSSVLSYFLHKLFGSMLLWWKLSSDVCSTNLKSQSQDLAYGLYSIMNKIHRKLGRSNVACFQRIWWWNWDCVLNWLWSPLQHLKHTSKRISTEVQNILFFIQHFFITMMHPFGRPCFYETQEPVCIQFNLCYTCHNGCIVKHIKIFTWH